MTAGLGGKKKKTTEIETDDEHWLYIALYC